MSVPQPIEDVMVHVAIVTQSPSSAATGAPKSIISATSPQCNHLCAPGHNTPLPGVARNGRGTVDHTTITALRTHTSDAASRKRSYRLPESLRQAHGRVGRRLTPCVEV